MDCRVPLVTDWLDESTLTIRDHVARTIHDSPPGSILLLDNKRRYAIERVLWKAQPEDLPKLAESLAHLANEFARQIARAYVNEALSAGSLDVSSTIVPAAMDRVALGSTSRPNSTGRCCVAGHAVGRVLRHQDRQAR